MIMALDESCMACGQGSSHNEAKGQKAANTGSDQANTTGHTRPTQGSSERESFLRKYESLGKDELSAAFMVPFEDLLNLLGTEIPCVGCRRSVESLLQKLFETCESESL